MNRRQLERVIGAAATIAEDDDIIVVGSQAILGQLPDAPAELLRSDEADVYPMLHPERADLIDARFGELSPFHDTFGYYCGLHRRRRSSGTVAPELAGRLAWQELARLPGQELPELAASSPRLGHAPRSCAARTTWYALCSMVSA